MTDREPLYTPLKRHVFVCINEREQGHQRGCCSSRGGMELVNLLKEELAVRKLRADVRVNKAGCLDTCEAGPSLVVYPEGVWYSRVRPEDVPEIVEEHLVGGRPVERILTPGKHGPESGD